MLEKRGVSDQIISGFTQSQFLMQWLVSLKQMINVVTRVQKNGWRFP